MGHLRGCEAFGDRHDRRARRHQLAHGAVGERQDARHDLDLVGAGERVSVGAGKHGGERRLRRRLAPRDERRQHVSGALHPRQRLGDDRLRPAAPQHARDEVGRVDEQGDDHRHGEHAKEGRRRLGEQRGHGGRRDHDPQRRERVGGGEHPAGVLEQADGCLRPAQLIMHPTRELDLRHRGRGHADRCRDAGQAEAQEQDHQGGDHTFSKTTRVTRRRST